MPGKKRKMKNILLENYSTFCNKSSSEPNPYKQRLENWANKSVSFEFDVGSIQNFPHTGLCAWRYCGTYKYISLSLVLLLNRIYARIYCYLLGKLLSRSFCKFVRCSKRNEIFFYFDWICLKQRLRKSFVVDSSCQ